MRYTRILRTFCSAVILFLLMAAIPTAPALGAYDIELDPEEHIARVNEGICKGCGTCAASCRSNAIKLKGFTDDQILAAIEVLQGDDV